jgi:hypothetical protein
MLKEITKKLDNFKNVFTDKNFEKILFEIFDSGIVTDETIKTIQDRLYKKGIDAEGNVLKTDKATFDFYSPSTIGIKKAKNQRTKNVTLNDSGDFYKSFDSFLTKKGFYLKADFQKDNHIFDNFTSMYNSPLDFENAILNLTEQEKQDYIILNILPEFILYLIYDIKEATK